MDVAEDDRLMTAAKLGDLDGIAVLFEKYHQPLLGFFRRLSGQAQLSEDLAQETFWRILRYRKSYDPRRSFRAWMYQIARNVMNDHGRKTTRAGRIFDDRSSEEAELRARSASDVSGEVERSDRAELLRTALSQLPLEKREVIVLCRFEELPQAEIARMLGCSVGALKVRLFRALKDLKDVFVELGGEPAL
ncbi:RNA polymerase sigma factor [Pelagicoccus sp. NFK12]|uniref:RNA polymerase sigma factor n=1 Tax=Pelagicoccus enzymogenes TaxID=2773457 RepID=A0A927FCZ8_9BACT|nr:RNA polymerase sigma factor [Pelagicoccus enzymogenes]MBD5782095.1 RNA polymerase sigma factor [Pelagicoccus enzymogenes]MDQ8196849.1 RNA polymerase sigma factor [Pelagicoccus enzymogenes]